MYTFRILGSVLQMVQEVIPSISAQKPYYAWLNVRGADGMAGFVDRVSESMDAFEKSSGCSSAFPPNRALRKQQEDDQGY